MICLPPLIADVTNKIASLLKPNSLLIMRAVNRANQACSKYNDSPVHQWCWNVIMRTPTLGDIAVYQVDPAAAIIFQSRLEDTFAPTFPLSARDGLALRATPAEMETVCNQITDSDCPALARGLVTHGYALNNIDILELAHNVARGTRHTLSGECIRAAHRAVSPLLMLDLHSRLSRPCVECEAGIMNILAETEGNWVFESYFNTAVGYWSGIISPENFLESIRNLSTPMRQLVINMAKFGRGLNRKSALALVKGTKGECIGNRKFAEYVIRCHPEIFILALRLIDSSYYLVFVQGSSAYAMQHRDIPITRAQRFALMSENPIVWASASQHFSKLA